MGFPSDRTWDSAYLLEAAIDKRSMLFNDPGTDCFRIFNTEGEGIDGLTVDYYAGYILIQYFNKSAENIIKSITPLLVKKFPVRIKGILSKNRTPLRSGELADIRWTSAVIEGDYPADDVIVIQNGVKARVDLVNGQNTGIFLDMREIRESLAPFYRSSGIARMLNLFSYTALFSVHALKNGASGAVNIDLSKGVLSRAKVNYVLNGLKIDDRDFIYGDAVEWMKRLHKNRAEFNFAVFDPPTFARNRGKNFSVKKDYYDALRRVELLLGNGYILTSINSYTVSEMEYRSYHPPEWELLMFSNESSDFVNKGNPYLKAGLWKIR